MSTLPSSSSKLPFSSFTVIVLFVCLSLIGMALVTLLPVKLSPSRNLPAMTVTFSMPGHSSRIIEAEVTSKLEAMLTRVKGIQHVSSTSDNGQGCITLELDKHADMAATRFEVSTIIRQTWPQLPQGVSYPQLAMRRSNNNAARPFMAYTLNASTNPIDIQRYAEEHIKPLIGQLKGIYKVDLVGATPMEWQLEYDTQQLDRLGIILTDVLQAIAQQQEKEFLGICPQLDSQGGREWIRVVRVSTEQTNTFIPADITLQTADGNLITLDKLLTLQRVESQPSSYFRINGLNTVYMYLTAEETANQLELSAEVKRCMAALQAQMPAGYEIHASYDATEYIHKELDKIYFRTGLTLLILLLFVGLITWNLRYLFLIAVSLTVNLAVAALFYYLCRLEIQLYSLAGITISLNLVIDNTIVMTDHLLHRRNLKVFLALLAATLTTVGALVMIFFLDDAIRLNLQDFAAVVIINLLVSLAVALFFVPSLIEKIGLQSRQGGKCRLRLRRWTVCFSRGYVWGIGLLCRYRIVACLLLLLSFGLPIFLLPQSLPGEGMGAALYNQIFDTPTYKEKVKPVVDKVLGGTLRLFAEKVYSGSYFNRDADEVVLSVTAALPNGSTLEQMNELVKKMETYLTEFYEIKQFQTSIYSAQQAGIQIFFKEEYQHSDFPYTLKASIISKALTLGGGSWGVYGLQDQGFSNDVRESAGSFQVKMYGYNYDELAQWADTLKAQLLAHRRIKEVTIGSEFSWWKEDYCEFFLDLDKRKMAMEGMSAQQLFTALHPIFGRDLQAGSMVYEGNLEMLKLNSHQSREYDVWGLTNLPFLVNGRSYKLSNFATIEKGQSPQKVAKEDQQYRICLQYEYVGSQAQGKKLLEKELEQLNARLPMGYTAVSADPSWKWTKKDNRQYGLLLVIIAIIFVIPISYIGVFLTFYLFGLNFDQGGFASFVLLCGITVNASIYLLNEFNTIRRQHPGLDVRQIYVKAWNAKIIPIFLTVVSTILGFVPFLVGTSKEAFWFPLAAGTIGGLLMSLVGILVYLPLFTCGTKGRQRFSQ